MIRGRTNTRTTIHVRGAAVLGAIAVFATACGDSSLDPSRARAATGLASASRFDGSYSFTYDPAKGITTKLSDKYHTISIPAYGVCDPDQSSYGPGTWDSPCPVLTHPITITVTSYADKDGSNPYVDFSPNLRFVPSKVTILTFNMKKATVVPGSTINYCVTADLCVNEGLTDESLATNDDGKGRMSRRIKHFSGYNVAAGVECDPTLGDPDCIEVPDGDLNRTIGSLGAAMERSSTGTSVTAATDSTRKKKRRSGYMVVSGLEQQQQ